MTERTFRNRLKRLGLNSTKRKEWIVVTKSDDVVANHRGQLRIELLGNRFRVWGPVRVPKPNYYGSYSTFEKLFEFLNEYYFGELTQEWRQPAPAK